MMDDNGQIVAVGFILVVAMGAALAFGGLIELPNLNSNPEPVEVLGIEFEESQFSPAAVELNVGFSQLAADEVREEISLEKHIYARTVAQAIEQTQTQAVTQVKEHGFCSYR